MNRALLAFALVGTTAFGGISQPQRRPLMSLHPVGSETVDRIGPEEIQDIRHGVAPDARGAILPRSIDGRAQYILNFRHDASEPERHDAWDDIIIVQHGFGHVEFGRAMIGGTKYSDGEWRGGALDGELTSLDLAPGVVVRIPAHVPHVIRPLNSVPLVYLTVKEMVTTPR